MTDLFPRAGTFDIVPSDGGFRLIDTDTFNNWGTVWGYLFDTSDAATDWAWKCHEFKTGLRMTLERPTESSR